ncbi:uncharacterized protein SAPINGB_P002182 [Magnusiomyces paraingens]|uniref:Transcription factor tau subunit sfc6 n=1 Tax=Magnusiomyces paraingens TaxID=2606893 RepID=A0A5E8BI86_9ASCO|nr:uncharacterized protein SAPINGB_P002182 [Saprochaete ingens]VVT49258.1 unnamed protein product [Saprochaete ingens]
MPPRRSTRSRSSASTPTLDAYFSRSSSPQTPRDTNSPKPDAKSSLEEIKPNSKQSEQDPPKQQPTELPVEQSQHSENPSKQLEQPEIPPRQSEKVAEIPVEQLEIPAQQPDPPKRRRGRPPKNSKPSLPGAPEPPKPKPKPKSTPKSTTSKRKPKSTLKETPKPTPKEKPLRRAYRRAKKESEDEEEYVDEENNDDDDDDDDDFQEPDHEDDPDEPMDEEDDDFEAEDEKPRRRRGRSRGSSTTAKTPTRKSATNTHKGESLTASNKRKMQGSVMIQMHLLVGHDQQSLTRAVLMRQHWENSIFMPKASQMGQGMVYPTNDDAPIALDFSQQSLNTLSADEAAKFLVNPSTPLIIDDQQIPLFESKPTESPNSFFLNAGGVVTSISWAEAHANPETQYLAVGLLDDPGRDPVSSPIVSEVTSIFAKSSYPSSVYIYRVDLTNSLASLVFTLSGDFGSALKVAWRPLVTPQDRTNNSLGSLAVLSQDGGLRVYNLPLPTTSSSPIHLHAQTPFREYFLPDPYKIITFCWRTSEALSVASTEGQVAEFDISDTSEFSTEPSFFETIFQSAVITMTSGYPNNKTILILSSTDGHMCIFDVHNPLHRIYNHRRKGSAAVVAYLPHLECLIFGDDSHFAYATYIRLFKSHVYTNAVANHASTTMALAVSKYHPYFLSGGADGTVITGNLVRKLMARKRIKISPYEQGLLWALDFSSKEKKYRIHDLYKPSVLEKHKALDIEQIFPQNVTIKDLAWSTCFDTAEWYAAASTGGIIRFQRLYDT